MVQEAAERDERGDETPRTALRRDAERNRERIVAAARELYAEHGLGVGFNEVAHHAGVGVGTVYRRFADHRELLEVAMAEPLERLEVVAREAAATPRAWDGLVLLLSRITDLLAENIGLRDAALGGYDDVLPGVADGIANLTRELLARAHAEGDAREGFASTDIPMLLWMVTELAKHADDTRPDAYRRYMTVLLDGLRAAPGRAGLGEALAEDQAAEISRRWADSSARGRARHA